MKKNNDQKRETPAAAHIHGRWLAGHVNCTCTSLLWQRHAATFHVRLQLQLEASRLSASRARPPAIETVIVLPRHNWTIASENTNYKQPDDGLFIGCQVVKSCL